MFPGAGVTLGIFLLFLKANNLKFKAACPQNITEKTFVLVIFRNPSSTTL
jgi:hypothetical protein